MSSHPRDKHFPQHADYTAMAVEFRPFVMFTQQPGYRSQSASTDSLGLREQYLADGSLLEIEHMASRFGACNLVVGGSTVFGVDATSDKTTIAAMLNTATHPHSDSAPFVNMGIRGATCQQELIAFQILGRLLPKVERIVLISGVNEASMVGVDDAIFYSNYGGVFSEPTHFDTFANQYRRFLATPLFHSAYNFHRWIDERIQDSTKWQAAVKLFFPAKPSELPQRPDWDLTERFQQVMAGLDRTLSLWGAIARGFSIPVDYILQPAIRWCSKSLTAIEQECFDIDMKNIPSLPVYAHQAFYHRFREHVEQSCQRAELPFHDANVWFSNPSLASSTLFTDVCHLTDEGNRVLAQNIIDNVLPQSS